MKPTTTFETPVKVLHLEIACSGNDRLKASLSARSSTLCDTLRTYEETEVSLDGITHRSRQILSTLNQANRLGRLSHKLFQSLKETGQLLRDELLTPQLKEKLNTSDARYMTISIDEHLVHIPWELLHDGHQFLCQRFNVGRLVQTRQHFPGPCEVRNEGPLHILILADLDGTLPAARKEGLEIRDFIESSKSDVRVMMRSASVNADFLKTKVRSFDWVHFAGHADYDVDPSRKNGWRLSTGWFTAEDAAKMAGTGAMPRLVFANACQSARTNVWSLDYTRQRKLFGLVNAFLLAGTQHYVGTSWEIPDEPGRRFAIAFYQRLMAGATVGRAMSDARRGLLDTYGEEQVTWASYVLYGDPTHRYLTEQPTTDQFKAHPSPQVVRSVNATRAGDLPPLERSPTSGKRYRMLITMLALGIVTGAVWMAVTTPFGPSSKTQRRLQQAGAAFNAGDFQLVLDRCPPPEGAAPLIGCVLLRGNVMFVQGNLAGADVLFRLAGGSSHATAMESAEALIGLGRIHSIRGHYQEAMVCYQQAANAAPQKKAPLLALAMLNERMGNDQEAVALLDSTETMASANDFAIESMQRSLSKKVALNSDKERIERIDRLIDELSHRSPHISPTLDADPHQPPSHRPVWIMTMTSSGYSLQEGAAQLMTVMIESHLQQTPSLRIVDRHFMDKTLAELKLGSSLLADPQARLQLGRLQAVRLLVNGRIDFSGPETRISLRCIDTETSRVLAVIVEAFDTNLPLSEMAKQVADQLIVKIDQVFS